MWREGAVGSRAGQSQGIPCQAAGLLTLEMCMLSSAQQSNPKLTAALTQGDQMQAVLYGNSTEKRASGWVSKLGVGGADHMRPFALPDLILCAWVWGSSCDEDCPLKPKCPSPRNSLENVKSTSLGVGQGLSELILFRGIFEYLSAL